MDLLPKLRRVADAWVAANQRTDEAVSLRTLGVRAVANSKLFDRRGMSVSTFETVAAWLGDPLNWPAALVPLDACATLAELGIEVPDDSRLPAIAA